MALALAAGLLLVGVDAARAAPYAVVECGWSAPADAAWASAGAGFRPESQCDPATAVGTPRFGIAVPAGASVAPGAFAGWSWRTPPGVRLTELSARGWSWTHDGLEEQVGWLDEAGAFRSLWQGSGFQDGGARLDVRFPLAGTGFELRLACPGFLGAGCAVGGEAWSELAELVLTLEDGVGPSVAVGGDLAADGWRRGAVAGAVSAADPGSGLRMAELRLDGARVAGGELPCEIAVVAGMVAGTRLRPCPTEAASSPSIDTTALADGEHELRECAADFAGNLACTLPLRLRVDNTPPLVALDAGAPSGPVGRLSAEVSDQASGPATGSISYREEGGGGWTELPTRLRMKGGGEAELLADAPDRAPGTKLLVRAEARDAAGNLGASVLRAGGAGAGPVSHGGRSAGGGRSGGAGRSTRLSAWLGGSRRHRATATVAFGQRVALRGRLTGLRGAGLGGERLEVRVRPARGATSAPFVTHATTGRDGRFSLRLSPGTSRRLVVVFAGDSGEGAGDGGAGDGGAGSGGEGAARSQPLQLRVRAGVSLAAQPRRLRNGETLVLAGRVRRDGATAPRRGKLVAIQYLERATGRWRPVMVLHAGRGGAFHASYRFRYITGRASIRLRALALPEERWPYAPGSSRPLTVEVEG
jgi:hypothetical protein